MSAQLCLTLSDLMDCSPPGSSIFGILQARILEWAAISFSRGSSPLRDWTCVSYVSCIGRGLLNHVHSLNTVCSTEFMPIGHTWCAGFFSCKPNLAWTCLQVFWERNRQELQELIRMPEERREQASWIWLPDPGGSDLISFPLSLQKLPLILSSQDRRACFVAWYV